MRFLHKIKSICYPQPLSFYKRVLACLVAQSCPTVCNPWAVALKAPLSMEFSRQEHYNGLPFPFPGDLHDPGIKPRSPTLQADSLPSSYQER